jgi:subtilisin family serine protease
VTLLDTGVDPAQLPTPASLHPLQYDVRRPDDHGSSPSDNGGHGTLVAHIVNTIAPSARIVSIRTIQSSGSVSDVLAGLYLSQALGAADIINVSLRILWDAGAYCAVCRTPATGATNSRQLSLFVDAFRRGSPDSVIVAAAGNGSSHLAYPAALDGIVAVGNFDDQHGRPAAMSSYLRVPESRYVLATGGKEETGWDLGSKAGNGRPISAFGTSFAAAFISGLAAQFVACDRMHDRPNRRADEGMTEGFLRHLSAFCYRGWSGFDSERHGLGSAHWP